MAHKRPQHTGARYAKAARWIKTTATADPHAVCAECGQTLSAHPLGVNGKRQVWQAGHTVDGSTTWKLWTNVRSVPPPGDWLAAEASRCNTAKGKARADALARGFDVGL